MVKGVLAAAAIGAMFIGGCATCGHKECPICNPPARTEESLSQPAQNVATPGPVQVYAIPAAELAKQLEGSLKAQGFTITSSQSGVIQTDWKDYPGEFHIARRWQERSRFRVSVIPDVNNPTAASRFEVTEETQRRSNEKANWEPASRRPDRAAQVAAAIAPK